MAFTTAKTNWQPNERPTADDFNRIEANAEAGAKPALSFALTQSLAQASDITGVYPANPVAHTSRTGRVKITITIMFSNSTGASKIVALAPARNNALLVAAEPTVITMTNGEQTTVPLVWVDSSPTVGVSYNYSFRMRSTTNPGPTLIAHYICVEDI